MTIQNYKMLYEELKQAETKQELKEISWKIGKEKDAGRLKREEFSDLVDYYLERYSPMIRKTTEEEELRIVDKI